MLTGKIKEANSFTVEENDDLIAFALQARHGAPLSGYLAGRDRGGRYVTMLEDAWSKSFNVKHSIACNSATSGLLAAAFACDLKVGDKFAVPAMTMSATAAAPCFTGAEPHFVDVDDELFGINLRAFPEETKAIVSTNLFGHASLLGMNEWDKSCGVHLIEDNAQSPFAMAHGRYCGTMGHIGVFSLNIHKPLQCGEGGIIVTDDDDLAARMRAFINHGEHVSDRIGLNLRMPELCAVVALSQLQRAPSIIKQRVEQAEAIIDAIGFIPGLRPPVVRSGCTHVYYTIPFLIDRSRFVFCDALQKDGVPVVERYAPPVYDFPAFRRFSTNCPVADALHERNLFYIENCAYDFTKQQIKQIGEAFKKAAEAVKL
jgi:dTDP-4-amino-4,6-dideoxygalactose transaminase